MAQQCKITLTSTFLFVQINFENQIFIIYTQIVSAKSDPQKIIMSYLEQYMEKLHPMPNDVNRLLRLIRFLDKRVDGIQGTLLSQQRKFQAKLKELKEKKISEVPQELKNQYESILQKQKQMYGYAKQKQMVSLQLHSEVKDSYELIKVDLKNKIKDKPQEDQGLGISKKKKKPMDNINKPPPKQEQFLYDPNDLKYCYCMQGSFGEMVGCENAYCEKQWFHLGCVDEKSVSGVNDWYCQDCTKLRDKFKKPTIREFL